MKKTLFASLFAITAALSTSAHASICNEDFYSVLAIQKAIPKHCSLITDEDLLQVKKLEIQDGYLNPALFAKLENLEELSVASLSNRDMSDILKSLKSLRVLKLSGRSQDVSLSDSNGFSLDLPKLEVLELRKMRLVHKVFVSTPEGVLVQAHDAKGLPSLKSLTVRDASLRGFSSGFFPGLPALEHVDLSNNRIRAFYSGSFEQLKNLRVIALSGNPILAQKALNVSPETPGPVSVHLCGVSNEVVENLKANSTPAGQLNLVTTDCI